MLVFWVRRFCRMEFWGPYCLLYRRVRDGWLGSSIILCFSSLQDWGVEEEEGFRALRISVVVSINDVSSFFFSKAEILWRCMDIVWQLVSMRARMTACYHSFGFRAQSGVGSGLGFLPTKKEEYRVSVQLSEVDSVDRHVIPTALNWKEQTSCLIHHLCIFGSSSFFSWSKLATQTLTLFFFRRLYYLWVRYWNPCLGWRDTVLFAGRYLMMEERASVYESCLCCALSERSFSAFKSVFLPCHLNLCRALRQFWRLTLQG